MASILEAIKNTVVPPNAAVLGTGEKTAVFRNGGIGREYITFRNQEYAPVWTAHKI